MTTQADSRCLIVLTVPPGQDPQQTCDLVFENIVTADRRQSTDAISTFGSQQKEPDLFEQFLGIEVPNSQHQGINLLPFLNPTDGGTGEMLQDDDSPLGNPQLNPDNFRE